jgi:hypothetical protein
MINYQKKGNKIKNEYKIKSSPAESPSSRIRIAKNNLW